MKKLMVFLMFGVVNFQIYAQAKVITSVNDAGDVATYELDCSVKFQSLAKGMRYNITRHEFKGEEMKNSYRLMLVMDGFYAKTLNKEMTISAVLSDGTVLKAKKVIEDDGFFDGACTLRIKDPKALLALDINKIIIHADKDVVYPISAQNKVLFKKNLKAVMTAK